MRERIDTKTPLVLSAMKVDARAGTIRPAICARAGATEAAQQKRIDHGGILIDRQRLSYLAHHRIVAPAYTVMQDLIGKALSGEQPRVAGGAWHADEPRSNGQVSDRV